jgi:hypothetical protein
MSKDSERLSGVALIDNDGDLGTLTMTTNHADCVRVENNDLCCRPHKRTLADCVETEDVCVLIAC